MFLSKFTNILTSWVMISVSCFSQYHSLATRISGLHSQNCEVSIQFNRTCSGFGNLALCYRRYW